MTQRQPTRWGDRQARDLDIRESAAALLAEKGYGGLTMRAVAQGAGVSLGLLYNYYSSKEELFASLYAARLERFRDEVATTCGSLPSAAEVLEKVARLYLEVYREFGKDADAFLFSAAATPEGAATAERLAVAAVAAMDAAWSAFSRLEPRLGKVSKKKREAAMQLVWVTVRGMAEHLAGPRAALVGKVADELPGFGSQVLVRGLLAELLP